MKSTYSYFYLPNSLVETKMLPSDFAVAAYLYSVQQAYGFESLPGSCVKVRQSSIAQACKISVESVSRAVSRLQKLGVIVSKERTVKTNRHLGTYIYTLKKIEGRFFRLNRTAAKQLTPKELRCFALLCKLKENRTNMFFHSYTDLAQMLKLRRSEVIALINRLLELRVIHKRHQITAAGDYGENRYYIFEYMRGCIVKSAKAAKKIAAARTTEQQLKTNQFFYNLKTVYTINFLLSRRKGEKLRKLFFDTG